MAVDMNILKIMEADLSDADVRMLKSIYAPKVVGIPPEDARRSLCVMPDGEIRCYGVQNKKTVFEEESGEAVYLSSRDCGLSWKTYYTEGPGVLGASVRSPWSGRYLTIRSIRHARPGEDKGTYVFISDTDPSDCEPVRKKLSDEVFGDIFQPVALVSRKRWLCTMHRITADGYNPVVMISDDDGENWVTRVLPSTPKHTPVWPHRDVRWQNNGAEPSVAELPGGTLMLLTRTSLDYLYVYNSYDGGDSWTSGEPSVFHSTLTTPGLLRLSDGRILLLWCNTQPLPEFNHRKQWPPLDEFTIIGRGEDAFTNRDANHVAITSDGVRWTGFRELFLNQIRNDADFRSKGGILSSADKSVHQFQAIELPYGKILACFGQHEISRRMAIFDVNWLYETERTEDFQAGLSSLSTHVFVKSVSGCSLGRGYVGHCAWNRTNGALLVPDPDATHGEVLQLARIHDERLLSEAQGAVWNFPASSCGEVKITLRIDGAGVRLSLTDRWFNPTDTSVRELAQVSFSLDSDSVKELEWHTVRLAFSASAGTVEVYDGEQLCFTSNIRGELPNGFSYLHMQSLAESEDFKGTYIRRLEKRDITR